MDRDPSEPQMCFHFNSEMFTALPTHLLCEISGVLGYLQLLQIILPLGFNPLEAAHEWVFNARNNSNANSPQKVHKMKHVCYLFHVTNTTHVVLQAG